MRRDLVETIRAILLIRAEEVLDEEATFLELGLDSLHGVRFIQEFSRRLGRPLRETLIFDYPTIADLAEYLSRGPVLPASFKERLARLRERHDVIVPLGVAGDGPLLFCIHPMSGDVGIYSRLAEAAGTRFRVIGLRSRGFLSDAEPLATLEAMGAHCARIIAEIDPDGPWHLLGSSMGGTVAYETARQLQAEHGRVATLILVEAPLIESAEAAAPWASGEIENHLMNANFLLISMLHLDPEFRRRKAAGAVRWFDLEIRAAELGALEDGDDRLVARLVELIRERGVTRAAAELAGRLASMASIHRSNLLALNRYRASALPRPREPKAFFLRSLSGDATSDEVYNPDYLVQVQRGPGGLNPFFEGWPVRLPGLVTRVVAGANHFDLLNTAGAVEEIAAVVSAALIPDSAPVPVATVPESAIAVIGMSGRFPGGETLEAFFRLLTRGESAIAPLPGNRGWVLDDCAVTHGGFLSDIDRFDPLFFRIPPKEAEMMDPAERLFLMEGWRGIEDAGIDPASLSGANWGVFCGGGGDYTLRIRELTGLSPHVTQSAIPGRLAYTLNLAGPCLSVDVGCASSLLAVAQACDHLILDKCDVAIAGGVMVHSTPNLIRSSDGAGLLSRGERGHALDRRADGMLPGEGVGVLILKPLKRALADGDRIHGVIEGWGNNHSGKTNGMAAPSARAQAALLAQVHRRFGIDPATIGLMEANATGTLLGDTLEVEALTEVFAAATPRRGFCALGSVENHIGHSYQCSGVAHLLKVLLALKQGVIPGTLHAEQPAEALELERGPFFINSATVAWARDGDRPRRAAVNSFGATGSNVHLVVAEAPPSTVGRPSLPPQPFETRRCWLEATDAPPPRETRADSPLARVQGLLREVTGYAADEVAPDAPLSRYGLDSLMSLRLLAMVNERFGLELHLADLAVNDSLAALARLIGGAVPRENAVVARPSFSTRLGALPDSLHAVRIDRKDDDAAPSLSRCRPALSQLARWGIGVINIGAHDCFVASRSVDITARIAGLGTGALAALPPGLLVLPVSQEQHRNLHHTEAMGYSAWNVQHIYVSTVETLDLALLTAAVNDLARRHDLLRTRFLSLDDGAEGSWVQAIEAEPPAMLQVVAMASPEAFRRFIAETRLALQPVGTLPILRIWVSDIGGRWYFGFVTHHALADAFTTTLLFTELMSLYGRHPEPIDGATAGEQYWHYALAQIDERLHGDAPSTRYWRERLAGRATAMRLPYAVDPAKVDDARMSLSAGHALLLAPELSEAIDGFSRDRAITVTQLFTAAIVLALVHGMGNPRALIRYVHTRRDRTAILNTPGEFTNVLFVPFEADSDATVIGYLGSIKHRSLEALRHAKVPFAELLALSGLETLDRYYRQVGDVMIDSADLDAGTLGTIDAHGRSLHGDGFVGGTPVEEDGGSGPGQALGTLFFQLLRVNRRIHIVTTGRRALFDAAEMRRLSAFIVALVGRMIKFPEQPLSALLAQAEEPIGLLRQWTQRFAPPPPSGPPPVVPAARRPFFVECQRVNPVTTGQPVFWVHGAFGDASVYRALAERIDRPFYGLQARGLIDAKEPLVGVEPIAAFYREMIQAIQPQGPYDLGGYSIGGTLVYEIARQLQAAGATVNSLILADPLYPPRHSHLGGSLYDLYHFLAVGLIGMSLRGRGGAQRADEATPERELETDEARLREAFVGYCLAAGVDKPQKWVRDYLKKMAAIQMGYRVAAYTPRPLRDGIRHVHYFRNREGLFFGRKGRGGPAATDPLDGVDYWSEWRSLLPTIEYQEIDIDSHLALFDSPSALDAVADCCRRIYRRDVSQPTTGAREKVIDLVSSLLHREPSAIEGGRPLSVYGLDSLLSTQLLQRLRTVFDIDLDLSTLARLETVDQIVAALAARPDDAGDGLDRRRRFPELVPLNRGAGRPVFWFHGGLGGVEAYRVVAEKVARPFYGIQARGWMTDRQPLRGVEAMAAYYVQVIQSIQPRGPYDLGGYSLGGVLAYEITRQMQELGERVTSIVMLDSYDVMDTEASPLFNKRAMLGTINMALQSALSDGERLSDRLIHRDTVDPGVEDELYWKRLLERARERGLTRSAEQLQASIDQMSKFGHALEGDRFTIRPLADPGSVTGYYFRNASGRFYGDLEPYFTLPGSTSVFIDGITYWGAWSENIPNLQIVDVPSANHTTLLSDPVPAASIIEFCGRLYGGRAIG